MKLQICDRCQKNVYELYAEGRKKLCKECAKELSETSIFISYLEHLKLISQQMTQLETDYRDVELKMNDYIDIFCKL